MTSIVVCDRCRNKVSSSAGTRRHISTYSGVTHTFDMCDGCFAKFMHFMAEGRVSRDD